MDWARGRPDAEGTSLLTVTISLALATTAGVRLLGGDEILAAFVAGAVLNNSHRKAKVEEHHERFSEALGRFFDLPVMILFGAAIPWRAWIGLGWWGLAFAVGILLFRRMPAWFVLGALDAVDAPRSAAPHSPDGSDRSGAAALFYAMMIQDETGSSALWPAISLAIGASVLAHGVTSTPLTRLFGRGRPARPGRRPSRRTSAVARSPETMAVSAVLAQQKIPARPACRGAGRAGAGLSRRRAGSLGVPGGRRRGGGTRRLGPPRHRADRRARRFRDRRTAQCHVRQHRRDHPGGVRADGRKGGGGCARSSPGRSSEPACSASAWRSWWGGSAGMVSVSSGSAPGCCPPCSSWVVIALLLPAVFSLTERTVGGRQHLAVSDEQLSIGGVARVAGGCTSPTWSTPL